jgi:hypothetical protein
LPLFLVIAACLLCGGLLYYSLTAGFTGDEGFHLLAAQLIDKGRRPYIDFAFPQTPLNAYFNALLLRVFGQTWRVPHAAATVLVIAAALLAAQFVWARLPASPKWRGAAALATLIAISSNVMVVEYGPLAQAYAICLFLTVAAFRLTVAAAGRARPLAAAAAGLAAGAAPACSLLTATAGPVYLLWLLLFNRAGNRWKKAAAFCIAGAVPFAPAVWLWLESHRPVIFNLFEYHLFFRTLYWPNTQQHDLEIMASWIDSGQALLLLLLSLGGLLFIFFRSQWELPIRREFYLCAWLTVAMGAEIATAHPTFPRYFLLIVPFVAILAAAGLYVITERVYRPESPYPAVAALVFLLAIGLGNSLYHRASDVRTWAVHEQLAKKIEEVVPRSSPILADEELYFLTQRTPPPGLEFSYSHKLKLAPDLRAQLHIITQEEIDHMAAAGQFAAVATCDDEVLDALKLDDLYLHKYVNDDCYVYWGHAK